jgi:hypothetical protein
LQKIIHSQEVIQKYRCPNPLCGKEYDSMQVFELQQNAASGGRAGVVELLCMVCNEEVQQVISEGADQELGDEAARKKKIKVKSRKSSDELGLPWYGLEHCRARREYQFSSWSS